MAEIKIPQINPAFDEQDARSVYDAVKSNWVTEGPRSKEFQTRLNALIGTRYGVFAPNGTLALFLGLLALGIKKGDEVIVPDSTFIASANAVILTGAKPVFADVKPGNFQLDIAKCEALISVRTKAIMPVHLNGMIGEMEKILAFAKKHKLFVIEDAAQAIAVSYKNKHAGTFGDVGCFSFFVDKTMTTAEGGYVVCKSEKVYKKLLYLRNQGRLDRGSFIHPEIGYNFRMTDIQAALGIAQLKKLPLIIKKKLRILSWYKKELAPVKEIAFMEVHKGSTFVPFRAVVFCERAHALMEFLAENGIQPRGFFYPLHKQPCFSPRNAGHLNDADFKNSNYAYDHGVFLQIFPSLTKRQVKYICDTIKKFYGYKK